MYCYICILVAIQFVLKCCIVSQFDSTCYNSKLLCQHFGLSFHSVVYCEYLAFGGTTCLKPIAEYTHIDFSVPGLLASFVFSFFYLPGISKVTKCKFADILHCLSYFYSTILDLNLFLF